MRVIIAAAVAAGLFGAEPAAAQPPNPVMPGNAATTQTNQVLGKTIEEWIRQVDNPDPSVRAHAIQIIMHFPATTARRAIPALVKQVNRSNDFSPMANAIIALGHLMQVEADPVFCKSTVDALTQALGYQQAIIRYQAATALASCGKWAHPAFPKLAQMVNDPSSWETRQAVCIALGVAGRDERGIPELLALRALIDAIDDNSKEVRASALQSLINLGPPLTPNDLATMKNLLEKRLKADKDKACIIWLRVTIM